MQTIVIGGGAAGFFAAIQAAKIPNNQVTILEKSPNLLTKVRISGGGRCNVTHACFSPKALAKHYPRGEKALRAAFEHFAPTQTIQWFAERSVKLKTEADGRMFPVTDSSQTIIDCLMHEAERLKVCIKTGAEVLSVELKNTAFELQTKTLGTIKAHKLIVATGGSPKLAGFDWLKVLGHNIVPPVPSLFTFNVRQHELAHLMGLSVPQAQVRVLGQKLVEKGPLLITHWGFSGPAVLRTSAWGARVLKDLNYQFQIGIAWLGTNKEAEVLEKMMEFKDKHPQKLVSTQSFEPSIAKRLWENICLRSQIEPQRKWSEMNKSQQNKLLSLLTNDVFEVCGKTTFKEEFVTAGGVSLSDVDFRTMQSKHVPNLYFTGEVLDIDGITGGFNFQAAWTTGYIAGQLL
ncbi:MAG: NAD(P)/FAD-dependent oxidoreductase [Cytophagales bacterium]|nr:MAG: NAD(P)/FAD-dependent oxidoreductase [Cytophagales bacterium]TAF59302.1 MAG: NAD(P)/FAD-dependent oxidoreductase [Cytophagales bacterium]